MQVGKFFQELAIGQIAVLNAALHRAKLERAYIGRALCFIATLQNRFFLRIQFCHSFALLPRILLLFCLDLFDSFLDLRNSERDFFLFLLEFFERDDPATGHGLYQLTSATGDRIDYADNSIRFGFFSRAILETIRLLNF